MGGKHKKRLVPAGSIVNVMRSDQANSTHLRYIHWHGFSTDGSFIIKQGSHTERIPAGTIVMTLEGCRYDGSPRHALDSIRVLLPDGRIFMSCHVCLDLSGHVQ